MHLAGLPVSGAPGCDRKDMQLLEPEESASLFSNAQSRQMVVGATSPEQSAVSGNMDLLNRAGCSPHPHDDGNGFCLPSRGPGTRHL